MQHACYALGGSFTTFGGLGAKGIAPLNHLKSLGVDWGYNWLVEMARLNGITMEPKLSEEIHNIVSKMMHTEKPNLRGFQGQIQDRAFRAMLKRYDDSVLNSDDEDLNWADFTVFETQELFDANKDVYILALDYIFRQVESRFTGRPTLLILDEAWAFLQDPIFVERIRSWIKEARKANVAVVLATQSVSDAAGSEITATLIENCMTKIYLPNAGAKTDKIKEQYHSLGVNDAQIDLISRITPKKDYYVVQPGGQRVVDFLIGPAALSIIGRTSTADSMRAGKEYSKNPEYWIKDVQGVIDKNFLETNDV